MTNNHSPPPPIKQKAGLLRLQENITPSEFILDSPLCTIGRAPTCNIVIAQPEQKIVSRLHAKIVQDGPRYLLYDHHSANGTFVNEYRISQPHLLKHDDVIGLGAPLPLLRFNDPDPTDVMNNRLNYNPEIMTFFLDHQPLNLTPYELRLLYCLYQQAGEVCSREVCAEVIWQREYDPGPDDDNLDRIMSNIRQKLRAVDTEADQIIQTHRGLGYRYIP